MKGFKKKPHVLGEREREYILDKMSMLQGNRELPKIGNVASIKTGGSICIYKYTMYILLDQSNYDTFIACFILVKLSM